MAHRRGVATRLEYGEVAGEVGALVGRRVLERVADAGLGGEVDHAVRLRRARGHDGGVGDVAGGHLDAGLARKPGGPRALQGRVVVAVEVVQPEHAVAPGGERQADVVADEARGAGDEDGGHGPRLAEAAAARPARRRLGADMEA